MRTLLCRSDAQGGREDSDRERSKGGVRIHWLVWTLLILAIASIAGGLIFVYGGSYAIAYIATFPPRRRLKRTPEIFGAKYENVAFPSRDGMILSGWFVPSVEPEPCGVVVLCHGMSANRSEMLPWAASLWNNGFSLLLFDFRAAGQSEGDKCTAGCFEPQDLRGAVDYVQARPDCAELSLGVFGFSMGGATAILTAADDQRIQAVATHGAYATLAGAISQRCRHHFGPLAPISEKFIMKLGTRKRWFVAAPSSVAPLNAISRLAPRPLLLLHGERDPIIPAGHAHDLYAAAHGPKELHIMPRSRHKRIHRKIRLQAHERVVQFFCDHLL